MSAETWLREISPNDHSSKVLRLTDAKSRIPETAFIDGEAPDAYAAHSGFSPIEISWAGRKLTKHFVRSDSNKYMITDRSHVVAEFYDSLDSTVTHIAITALEDGKFLITPIVNFRG